MYSNSAKLFAQANKSIPGGVNSPVRAFKSVGGTPLFFERGKGAYLYDVDDREYVDFVNSWGPMILGYGNPRVVKAIQQQAEKALTFGASTAAEIELAELIKSMVPNIDLIRMVSSGTEACMSALRLARGYTKRNKLIKFNGCYHGHADPFLVSAGSGMATLNIQSIPGVTKGAAEDTIVAEYNDLDALEAIFKQQGGEVACVFIEPVAGNMGCVPPAPGFLEGIRKLCTQYGALLVFDEVMTGFRLAKGGAQELYNVEADLVCYGKVIGGGMPVGAFGGKKHIMEEIAPLGNVYQAGTLSGNPLAVVSGINTLSHLNEYSQELYPALQEQTLNIKEQVSGALTEKGIAHTVNNVGSMISVFFAEHSVRNFKDAQSTDIGMFKRFFHHLLSQGIYLPPSAFETWFISIKITPKEIDRLVQAIRTM